MARAINGEARGEPYDRTSCCWSSNIKQGKKFNFLNTIAGVIYQKGAFTAVADGQINQPRHSNSDSIKGL